MRNGTVVLLLATKLEYTIYSNFSIMWKILILLALPRLAWFNWNQAVCWHIHVIPFSFHSIFASKWGEKTTMMSTNVQPFDEQLIYAIKFTFFLNIENQQTKLTFVTCLPKMNEIKYWLKLSLELWIEVNF